MLGILACYIRKLSRVLSYSESVEFAFDHVLSAIFPRLWLILLLILVISLLVFKHLDLIKDAGLSKRLFLPLRLSFLGMSSLLKVMLDKRVSALD